MPFDQVLENYFASGKWSVVRGHSGWNNTTRFVEADGRKWVLRIYETHKDEGKIRYEHQVLLALNEQRLPFQVPQPVRGLHGSTIVRLKDGTGRLACLFAYIEGRRPPENCREAAYALGKATGQLSLALNKLEAAGRPEYPPYYELESAHPLCSLDQVAAFCTSPPALFAEDEVVLREIGEAIERFRVYLPQFRSHPHQLIHGDINHSNALVDENEEARLTAILDFEFVTWDLRAMELAVIVSGFLKSEEAIDDIDHYFQGAGMHLQLDRAEVEALPLLVQLRILDVFIHFLGRFQDGVDDERVVREQARSAYAGLWKLKRLEEQILQLGLRSLCANS